ncbi:MAG: hypothetical protein AB7O04_03425 [Hyphomonadaceae bacterium]
MTMESLAPFTYARPSAPPNPFAKRRAEDFQHSEALVVAAGAAAFGLTLGAVTAVAVGRIYPPVVVAGLLVLFLYAFNLAARSFGELLDRRDWFGASLYSLHILSFGLWPFAVMLFSPASLQFWFGFHMLLATLAAFLILAQPSARIIYRIGVHAGLLAALTAYQGVMQAIGG